MKKRIVSLLLAIIVMFCANPVSAASGNSYIFFFTGNNGELGQGTTYSIRTWLNGIGYTASRYQNYSRSSVLTMMGSCKTFHILAHGNVGFFSIGASAGGGIISYSDIASSYTSLSGLKFMFIESCYTGSGYSFQNTLYNLGVSASLAFTDTISASTDGNGIHYFADRFYMYAYSGHNMYYCANTAKLDTYTMYGAYSGSDSYLLMGYGVTL